MNKDLNSFWRGIPKVNNAKIPLASTVENCVDEPSICSVTVCRKKIMNPC